MPIKNFVVSVIPKEYLQAATAVFRDGKCGPARCVSEFLDAIQLRYEYKQNRCYDKKQIGESVEDIPVADCKING